MSTQSRARIALALTTVYLVWGSTYLALAYALESYPPFLLGGLRYSIAGGLLYAYARQRGDAAPTRQHWRNALLLGTLFFTLGNGLVGVAEESISSGVAAVVVATSSLWAVLFSTMFGKRPTRVELLGVALGLASVLLLQQGGVLEGSLGGFVAIVLAPIGWSLGSVWGARLAQPSGYMAAATQMLGGGLSMSLVGVALGERPRVPTLQANLSLVYLTLFGSAIAFSAYRYLLANTSLALATSCAFVNPVVALLLGAVFAGERLTGVHVMACALAGLAVVCALRARTSR